jgi:hypothetical protein
VIAPVALSTLDTADVACMTRLSVQAGPCGVAEQYLWRLCDDGAVSARH